MDKEHDPKDASTRVMVFVPASDGSGPAVVEKSMSEVAEGERILGVCVGPQGRAQAFAQTGSRERLRTKPQ